MYERGSNQWHDLSYGSGASYPHGSSPNGAYSANGSTNGSSNGSGSPEQVWYRSPAGEDTTAHTPATPPAPAYPLTTPAYESYSAPPAQPVYSAYEAQYAPGATQSFPSQTGPAAPEVVDVTTYDPVTGLPMADGAVVYPMRNVAGRMAMILGVFAILFTSVLFPLFPLAFFFAFGAIMLGRKGRLRARYGFASNPGSAGGGFALGVISMVLAVVWTAAAAWLFTSYSATDMKDCVQDSSKAAQAIHCIADVVAAG